MVLKLSTFEKWVNFPSAHCIFRIQNRLGFCFHTIFFEETILTYEANKKLVLEVTTFPEEIPPTVLDEHIGYCYERAGTMPTLRMHGDFHAGNVLWTDQGPHIVDLDDTRRI